MSKQVLKESFIGALKSTKIAEVADVADADDMVDDLMGRLIDEPTIHPTSFADYLEDDCGIPPKQILSVIQALLSSPDMVKNVGRKLSSLWLQFKLFQELGIHTNKPADNKQKRKAVKSAFVAYNSAGSNLVGLLMDCTRAAGEEMGEQEINDLIDMIGTKPGVDLPGLFYKEPENDPNPEPKSQDVGYNADKSVEEQLKDLIIDYKIFPEGSLEKELQRQLILAHIQKHKYGKSLIAHLLPQSKQHSDIEALKNKFIEQSISVTAEIDDFFKKAKTNDAYEALCTLKSKIIGINVLQLCRLIDKTNDAKKQIESRDVVFIIGNTGSGKSTNILRFLGYNLKPGKVGNLKTLLPTNDLQKEHKTFYTSPQTKSCTRYINAVPVPIEMYKKGTPERKMNLVICDSPGFGDSAGVQVDIANGVGMINALHGTRSVRVVIILPYDSLTGDRMAGAIKMGQIISNLFYELTVLESIVIYFNKTPVDQISEVPKLIENKIKNLNETEKSNHKLKTFLQEMHERSKDEENFIDPIDGDYKKLFQKICNIEPINEVRQSIQYEFTSSTKRQIDKFIQGERAKVRELFMVQNYRMSQFHFQMIEKMKHILHNDDRIKVYYQELTKFIQAESEKQLNYFEEIINEIMSARGSPNLKAKLDDSRNKIIEIEGLFKGFEDLRVVQASKMDEIIKGRKDRLLDQFNNLDEVTEETIKAAKQFSSLVDKTLEAKVIDIIERRFSEIYYDTDRQVKMKCYTEIGNNLKYLGSLATYISQLIQRSAINNLANRLRDLKTKIGEQAELALIWIGQNITKQDDRITENTIREANQKVDLVKQIEGLNFLENNSQIKTKLASELRSIQGKCKNTIRDIENLRLTLGDDAEGKDNIEKEELKNKKRQIEMLMDIENLGENLADDYKYAKESIGRRLRENVEILKNCIAALKSDKSDEINKNLDNIKKATNIVLQCSQIVDQADGVEIAESIGRQFIDYLGGVKNGLHTIEFKLAQINEKILRNIRQQHRKIESYAKMGSIGQQVQQAVNMLKNELIEKLKAPFMEYNTREVPYLKEKGHYKYIAYSVDKLEKFSTYALGVYDIVSGLEYGKISECEADIRIGLDALFKHMENDIEEFLNLQFAHSIMPKYLKDLVKTLLTISQKNRSCEYLTRKLNFQVGEKLNNIQNKLSDFKDRMAFAHQESQNNTEELQALLADCKQFGEIEDIYKSKGEPQNKFGFRELQRKFNEEFMKSLRSDEQRCRLIIEGIKPTKILFNELDEYYKKFVNIKTAEGIRKRRFIVSELKKVEQNTLNELNQFKQDIENLTFINDSTKIEDFLEAMNQAVVLERNLNYLYTLEEDKAQIQIKQDKIHRIGLKIIAVFESQYEIVIQQLKNFNLTYINEKLKTFGRLENLIYDVFNLENEELQLYEKKVQNKQKDYSEIKQIKEESHLTMRKSMYENPGNNNAIGEERLSNFIRDSVVTLQGMIQSYSFIKEAKFSAKNTKRLKNLLEILKRGVELEIKAKYESDGPTFTIDVNFQTFYSNSGDKKRQQLKVNVDRYLQQQYTDYQQKYNCEKDTADNMKNNIEQSIKYLPTDLRQNHKQIFNRIKNSLMKYNEEFIDNASKDIISNPSNIAKFFSLSNTAKNNGQKDLHDKCIKRLIIVYSEMEHKQINLDEKIAFIERSFIDVYIRQKEYFTADTIMFNEFKKKYELWINSTKRVGNSSIQQIHEILKITRGQGEKKIKDHKLTISNIFKVYYFLLKLKDNVIMDHTEFRQIFLQQYQQKLNEVADCYIKTLKNQPEQKINSKEIIETNNMKRLHKYVEDITFVGQIKEEIIFHINNDSNMNKSILGKNFQSSIQTVESQTSKLEQYEKMIITMYKYITSFQFCNDFKHNFTPKQMQQQLSQLDKYFEILKQGQQFFTKCIIKKEQYKYNIVTISTNLQKKFNECRQAVKKQIQETFKDVDGEPAKIINIFIKQLGFMRARDRDIKFIAADKVKESWEEIIKLVKQKFQNQKDICTQSLEILKVKYTDYTRQIQLLDSKRRQQVADLKLIFKNKIDTKLEELQNKYKLRLLVYSYCMDKEKKIIQNELANEQNSAKNEIAEQRDKNIKVFEDQIGVKVKDLNDSLLKGPVKHFAVLITIFQKAIQDIFEEAHKYKKHLDAVLENLGKVNPKLIKYIAESIENNPKDERSIGEVILSSSKAFAICNVARINRLMQRQDINYVLKNLQRITPTDRDKVPDNEMRNVQILYKAFKAKYDEHKKKFKNSPTQTTIKYMITPLKDLGTQIKQESYQNKNRCKNAQSKVQLLAGIFALWAILKAETFEGDVQYTIEPHPTQITTLILLLGISYPDEKQNNRLAQVGTGEGKSIILAGLSCFLALVGFKVRCACYSAYLSSRDQENFKMLFEVLGIENSIKYGTFNQLCEDILNGSGASLKDQIQRMLLQPPNTRFQKFTNIFGYNTTSVNRGQNQIYHNPTILVIDELDVFFEEDFFGNSYCPGISLRSPAVSNFLKMVWNTVRTQRKSADPEKLITTNQFDKLVDTYPTLQDLLKNQVHGMVAGALNYKHEYYIIDKRIAYKDNDTISYKINYGYKTVFAYLHEFQNNRVSKAYLDEALQITLMIAEFSYAALPNYFCNILGVTGTLQVLPHYKKKQLSERYAIKDQYAIPSAFGINKKRIENYYLTPTANYNKKIVEMINQVTDDRPIIIFFKGPRELNEFFNCEQYQPFVKRTYNLTEQHEASVRDSRICSAVEPKKITLVSSAFGRGTDFVIRNETIKEKGGLHVIHGFLSLDESEEVQIKGRTARQNGQGSYDCVIDESWLEQLNLISTNFSKDGSSEDIHSVLLRARQERMDQLSQTTMKMVQQADIKHQQVVKIFSKEKLAQIDLIKYVSTLNLYPLIQKVTIKTVLGLDATGSMSGALRKACEVIGTAFERNYAVLKQKDVKATIEVKIMVYRNYNSPVEQIIQGTTFENTPANLKQFLDRVGPKGGWGNEAIQVLFQFINREQKIDQVILIGDAAPNTQQEVKSKRNKRGEHYWLEKGFPLTNFYKQLETFKKNKKCPVHCFYLGAQPAFKNISQQTEGKCSKFKLHSDRAAEDLTNFVVTNILELTEKKFGGDKGTLIDTYRKLFIDKK